MTKTGAADEPNEESYAVLCFLKRLITTDLSIAFQ